MERPTAVVIEDNMDIRVLIKVILQRAGYTVQAAATGKDGVAAVRSMRPSLVTVDLGLPDRPGKDVISHIRAFATTPILIISGSNDLHHLEQALAAGADGYLPKPFRPETLRAHVNSLNSLARNGPVTSPASSDAVDN